MSDFTLGRAGVTGVTLQLTETPSWDGDEVSVRGIAKGFTSWSEWYAVVAQLSGYGPQNSDEVRVPVTWAQDDSINGIYEVVSVDVGSHVSDRFSAGDDPSILAVPFEARLVRVAGNTAPVVEVVRRGATRSNTHSFTASVFVSALPGGLKVPRFSVAQDAQESVATADGSVRVFADTVAALDASFMVVPESFYEGSCTVEVSRDEGVSWEVVVGRQVPNVPGWVRIGNGRVRCTVSVAGGASVLGTEVWDATAGAWEANDFHVTDGSASAFSTYTDGNISGPVGMCAGPDGNLWFTSLGNNSIGKITTSGTVTTYTDANIERPWDICAGPDGLLWFTSINNNRIGKITTSGTVTTYTDANVDRPYSICAGPDGLLWFTSEVNNRIGKITTSGTVTTYTDANISGPRGICVGPDDLLWFTSYANDRIGKITTAGAVTTYTDANIDGPQDICEGPDGLLWFTSRLNSRIGKITTGGSVTTYTTSVPAQPYSIASDGTDLWYTATGSGAKLAKITTSGTTTTYTDPNVSASYGVVKGPDNQIWFASYGNNRIAAYNPAATGALEFAGTLTILRNSPETVAIRLGANDGPEQLDLTLTRGHNYIRGRVQTDTATTLGVFRTASETGAAVSTYGVRANADNADGNRYIILSPAAVDLDTTGVSGLNLTAPATSLNFAVAPHNADTVTTTATLVASYFAAANERQTVTAR